MFLPPPQQGTSLGLNLSAGLNIHQEPDRQAKFRSNTVNPLQTERLPQEGTAWRALSQIPDALPLRSSSRLCSFLLPYFYLP